MAATILDGKKIALQIRAEVGGQAAEFKNEFGYAPTLAAVLVGEDPASQVYVRNKEMACQKAGLQSRLVRLPDDCSQTELLENVVALNEDDHVHGILVQLPLPSQIDSQVILDAIDSRKDVDAFHPQNVGLMSQGRPRFLPCTPHGIVQLLSRYQLSTRGKRVVVLGRSDIVGKPMAMMLAQRNSGCGPEYANATITIAHSATENLSDVTREAEVLIAAIGKPRFVTAEMVRPGAVVIDVGINRTDDGLVGDVDFEPVSEVASAITPVPGGVGPLTVAMLLHNTLNAARMMAVEKVAG